MELNLNSRKDLFRSLQEKLAQLEKLYPHPASLEKVKEEERVQTKMIAMEDALYEGLV